MKNRIIPALLLVCALALSGAALAESDYEFDATVVCVHPTSVTAAIGGTVADVPALAGQLVASGDVLATMVTDKIYAAADGQITGVFCEPGDSVSAVTDRYGALMYLEPDSKYTLTASTDNAYNASDNKYIHSGERVWLACSDGTHTGEGFVTSVSGTDFTVEVTAGSFYMGETVSVYRDEEHSTKSRIGRGNIERIGNIAVGGATTSTGSSSMGQTTASGSGSTGSVVAVHVSDGDQVKAGDLLAETLSGEYDAYYFTGTDLVSTSDGILATLNLSVGGSVNKGDVIATVYTRDSLQLKVDVNEADLTALSVGTPVQISFSWNEDAADAAPVSGTVSQVLYAADSSSAGSSGATEMGMSDSDSAAAYAAYIDFDADENTRIGMTATVRPVASAEADEADAEAEDGD